MQAFGQRLRQSIGQRFEHDAAVIIVCGFEARHVFIDAPPGSHRERSQVIGAAGVERRNEIGQAGLGLILRLGFLLP